jgi:hypothetical protein
MNKQVNELTSKRVNGNRIGKTLGTVVYVLFFQVFFVYKAIRKAAFENRKKRAIKRANKMAFEQGKHIHVIQIERRFIVGSREELKRYNKKGRKAVKTLSGSHLMDFDYKNAIVYTAKCESS